MVKKHDKDLTPMYEQGCPDYIAEDEQDINDGQWVQNIERGPVKGHSKTMGPVTGHSKQWGPWQGTVKQWARDRAQQNNGAREGAQ